MADHNDLGNFGEQLALEFLVAKGFKVLDTNWVFMHKEIDIIARKDQFIVFVEVKTRRTNYFGEPFTFVNVAKQRHIVKAADAYINRFDIHEEARFDIISVLYNDHQKDIKHIEDAFYARL
ncbi:MAG: YraN family protein [Bacteroidetes bacterium 4572_77]|nr:MAG: YraN family protein [Bacteroidetes bacterium 4572_77]